MTQEHPGTGDELWDEFVREHEKSTRAIHEPTAAERAAAAWSAPKPSGRGWMVPAAVAAAVLAVLVVLSLTLGGKPAKSAAASATPKATGTGTAGATNSAQPAAGVGAVTADQAFPAQAAGYTRVGSATDQSCTRSDTVGPTLAGIITQSHGCRGVAIALYRDAAGDEFTLDVFSMNDPGDAAQIVFTLGANPTDHQVAAQLPPASSGLRALPADSGLVQAFAGTKRLAVVGLAQWADGRSKDFQSLENKLAPLLDAVTKEAGRSAGA